MDQNLLLAVMAAFVVISAIALCIQAGLLFGIYKSAKAMQEHTTALVPQTKVIMGQASNLLTVAEATVQESHKQLIDIGAKAAGIVDSARLQMAKIDGLVTDATSRAHNQLERAELVVEDTVGRVHETVGAVHNGLLAPVRQINGLAAGVRTAVGVFLKGGRPNVSEATQEDEMFI